MKTTLKSKLTTALTTALATLTAAVLLFSAVPTTACAIGNWDYYSSATREEAFDWIWESYSFGVHIDYDDISDVRYNETVYSIAYAELDNFLDTYAPSSSTKMINIDDDFCTYMNEKWWDKFEGTVYNDDGNIDVIDEDGNVAYTFTYDEETDSYIRTSENSTEVVTYPAYHFPREEEETYTYESYISTEESATATEYVEIPDTEASATSSTVEPTSEVEGDSQTTAEVTSTDEDTEVSEVTAESESGSFTSAQKATLTVLGVLIACGIVAIIVLLVKRNKDNGNGSENNSNDT